MKIPREWIWPACVALLLGALTLVLLCACDFGTATAPSDRPMRDTCAVDTVLYPRLGGPK